MNALKLFLFWTSLLVLHDKHKTVAFFVPQHAQLRCRAFVSLAKPHNCDDIENEPRDGNHCESDEQFLDELSRREFLLFSAAGGILATLRTSSPATAKDPMKSGNGSYSDNIVPYSSLRKYKSITLGNGMQVLLVNDRVVRQSTAALTIGGAGQFSNPPDLDGLAHLMEHMILSSTNRSRRIGQKSKDFEDWLGEYDGSSNGFTAYEKVCFHFNCPTEVFSEALERFARLFLQEIVQKICRNGETLKREIRRINSEIDSSNDFTRELYLTKSLINQQHPYARLSAGNLETLENYPNKMGIDVGERLIEFFKEKYQPKRAILVVVSPTDISSLESWVAPFASTMSREKSVESEEPRTFPLFYPKRDRLSTICIFRRKNNSAVREDLEKLSLQWALNLDYNDMKRGGRDPVTATQIGFILSQIIARRGPGSLYALLKRRNWIPEGSQGIPRISFPVDVSGFQILKLQLTLTLQGFSSRSSVIAAVYDSINSLQNSPMSSGPFLLRRELIAEYATVAKLYGYILAPRPPDAIELAFDGQVYGVNGVKGVGNPEWKLFPSTQDNSAMNAIRVALQEVLKTMSDPGNAIIISTASTKAILFAEQNVLENSLPKFSPASWNISPVTGARYYFDNMIRLSGRVNEWLVARLMEDELSPPVLNPLIPATLRPPRLPDRMGGGTESEILVLQDESPKDARPLQFPPFRDMSGKPDQPSKSDESNNSIPEDATRTSIVRDYWAVLRVMSHEAVSSRLPTPRVPPEPSGRSVFVLQLVSSRPARADVKKAAHADLWKLSLEYAVSDLAELGAPAGLSYDISFNKYGMRICFLGLSQNIASYARRLSRRIVDHQSKLLASTDKLPAVVVDSAVRSATKAPYLSPRRRKEIVAIVRESTAADAAVEGVAFFKSCSGGVCFTQGDILPKEAISLLGDLKSIFRSVTGSNVKPTPAVPDVEDILYRPTWMPRSAFSCTIAGASLISNACGRVPR